MLPFVAGDSVSPYSRVKIAPIVLSALIPTLSGLTVPEAAPVQPVKTYPGAGSAVRVAVVPVRYFPPAARFVILPLVAGLSATVYCRTNVAPIVASAATVTASGLVVPLAPPVQPVKTYPAAGSAVSVAVVPMRYFPPAPKPVMLPFVTALSVSVYCRTNVAPIVASAATVTARGLVVPLAPPVQPVKTYPAAGTAVSVAVVPVRYFPPVAKPVILPLAASDSVTVYCRTNAAPIVASDSTVTASGLVVPEAVPVQPVKTYPAAGSAVSVAVVPVRYFPPVARPVMLPFVAALSVTVYWRTNVAPIVASAATVTARGLVVPEAEPVQPVKA